MTDGERTVTEAPSQESPARSIEAELEGTFPGWHVWRSDAGSWWATRRGRLLSDHEFEAGLVATATGGTWQELRTMLSGQSQIEARV